MRIVLGPADPAGVGSALAGGLRGRGHGAEVVTWVASPWGFPSDRVVGTRMGAARFAVGGAARFDVMHVMGGRSWLFYSDMLVARARGRLALIQYNGSDCRTSDVARALHPARARVVDPARDRSVRVHRRRGARAARAAVVQDLELVDYLRGDFARIYVAPFAIHMEAIERVPEAPGRSGPLRVLHAPSHRGIKGSDAIEAAVRAAAGDGAIELVTVSGRPHDEVLAAIARADLVVDQLNSETPGVLAAEAMALGKPVICEYEEEKLAPFARPCPVVAATPETLEARVRELAADAGRRRELGEAGSGYAPRVHHPDVAAAAAEAIYEHAREAPPGIYESGPAGLRPL